MFCKEIIPFNGKLYLIQRKFKESNVNPEKINEFKELLGSSIVLKQKNGEVGYLFFLTEIEEAVLVE